MYGDCWQIDAKILGSSELNATDKWIWHYLANRLKDLEGTIALDELQKTFRIAPSTARLALDRLQATGHATIHSWPSGGVVYLEIRVKGERQLPLPGFQEELEGQGRSGPGACTARPQRATGGEAKKFAQSVAQSSAQNSAQEFTATADEGESTETSLVKRFLAITGDARAPPTGPAASSKPPSQWDEKRDIRSIDQRNQRDLDIGHAPPKEVGPEGSATRLALAAPVALEDQLWRTARMLQALVKDASKGHSELYWNVAITIAEQLCRRPDQRWLQIDDVKRAVRNGRQAYRRGVARSVVIYFLGAMRRKFEETGHCWPHGPDKPR